MVVLSMCMCSPFDYAASELGVSAQYNPSKLFIDLFAKLGLVYGRKRATRVWAKSRYNPDSTTGKQLQLNKQHCDVFKACCNQPATAEPHAPDGPHTAESKPAVACAAVDERPWESRAWRFDWKMIGFMCTVHVLAVWGAVQCLGASLARTMLFGAVLYFISGEWVRQVV